MLPRTIVLPRAIVLSRASPPRPQLSPHEPVAPQGVALSPRATTSRLARRCTPVGPQVATSRFGRSFWRPAQTPPKKQRPNPPKTGRCATPPANTPVWEKPLTASNPRSPKQGRCATPRHNTPAREKLLLAHAAHSPKAGRCADSRAQRPCLGEIGGFEQRKWLIMAQGPCLGEKQVLKVPAWEKQREGPTRLPAGTSEALTAQKGGSLPRRDPMQIWAILTPAKPEFSQAKTMYQE